MITKFKIFEDNENDIEDDIYDSIDNSFQKHLLMKNITIKLSDYSGNEDLYIGTEYLGTIRFSAIESEWVIMENIELKKDYIGKGIGYFIYESLFKSSKENKLKGLVSLQYSEDISQRRSELATKLIKKLITNYGGEIHDISDYILQDEFVENEEYNDYFITGSKIIKKIKV